MTLLISEFTSYCEVSHRILLDSAKTAWHGELSRNRPKLLNWCYHIRSYVSKSAQMQICMSHRVSLVWLPLIFEGVLVITYKGNDGVQCPSNHPKISKSKVKVSATLETTFTQKISRSNANQTEKPTSCDFFKIVAWLCPTLAKTEVRILLWKGLLVESNYCAPVSIIQMWKLTSVLWVFGSYY